MRVALVLTSAMFLTTPVQSATSPEQVCTPTAPPTRPVTSEDNLPGAGVGLNDDVTGRDVGTMISEYARIREDETGPPLARDIIRDKVGLDCPKNGF